NLDCVEKKKIALDEVLLERELVANLTEEVNRLNAAMAPVSDEHLADVGLITRAKLVGKIAELTGDVVEGTNYAFENVKEQLM
ncbi:hypothetical protein A2U01_0088365, partial [Trifolium medium]|nr:hypothetical protein [Trifolium medium]